MKLFADIVNNTHYKLLKYIKYTRYFRILYCVLASYDRMLANNNG